MSRRKNKDYEDEYEYEEKHLEGKFYNYSSV